MRELADEAMQRAIMVCETCGAPVPPGAYWFHSNEVGENLGGIFCSKGCVDIAKLSGAEPPYDPRGSYSCAVVAKGGAA